MPGADLALTSSTIADAREVFEIVIEIQLMVLYAMKIYWGYSLYEGYYISSSVSTPLFQVSGKFVEFRPLYFSKN